MCVSFSHFYCYILHCSHYTFLKFILSCILTWFIPVCLIFMIIHPKYHWWLFTAGTWKRLHRKKVKHKFYILYNKKYGKWMSKWGTAQRRTEWKKMLEGMKKLQRIRIKSWIIITNSYIIKTSDERWMNEWMSLWMEITDTELCSAALWWWLFLLHWGVEKCVRCCMFLSYGNKFVSDLWFMIDCEKKAAEKQSVLCPLLH